MEQLSTQLFSQFFSLATAAFAVSLGIIVFFVRRIVETVRPNLKVGTWWNEVILPLLPILLGVVIAAFVKAYPYPDLFAHSAPGRIVFGLCAGGASDLLYSKVKRLVEAFVKDDSASIPGMPKL